MAATVVLLCVGAACAGATGELTQFGTPSPACIWTAPIGLCGPGLTVTDPVPLLASPDGKFVYAASFDTGIAILARTTTTGALRPSGCFDSLSSTSCAHGVGVYNTLGGAMSADGKSVYLGTQHGVLAFARNATTGALSELGCFSGTLSTCQSAPEQQASYSVAVSADGKSVYATSSLNAVTIFQRNTTTGVLTRTGCVRGAVTLTTACPVIQGLSNPVGVTVSKDNKTVYVAGLVGDLTILHRNATSLALTQDAAPAGCLGAPPCAPSGTVPLSVMYPFSVTASPDNKSVYVAGYGGVLGTFARNTTTGALAPAGCVAENAADGCQPATGLTHPWLVTVSKDAKSVYASSTAGAIAEFGRNTTTGAITEIGCLANLGTDGCAAADALTGVSGIVVTADNKSAYAADGPDNAIAAFSRTTTAADLGRLHQLDRPPAACVGETSLGDRCSVAPGLRYPGQILLSKDGKSAYVAAHAGTVAAFRRNPTTGVLTSAGCLGTDTGCTPVPLLGSGLFGAAISPDGKSVLAPSTVANRVTVLARNTTTGALAQASCVSTTGGGGCTAAPTLSTPVTVVVSKDSKFVYVLNGSAGGGMTAFTRNTATGALTVKQCFVTVAGGGCTVVPTLGSGERMALSADGKSLYATSLAGAGAVQAFVRNTTTGTLVPAGCVSAATTGACAQARGLGAPRDVAVSPDNKSVYVTSQYGDLAVFARNATTAALTQLPGPAGCIGRPAADATCAVGHGFSHGWDVAVSPDGKSVYVTDLDGFVAILDRSTQTATLGRLSQDPGSAGCLNANGTADGCSYAVGISGVDSVAVGPNNKQVYVTGTADAALASFTRRTSG